MAFGESCVKFFVAGANFTFALGGLSLLLTGLVYKLNIDAIGDAIPKEDQNIRLVPTLTIIVGAIVFVIAFFGCCGAIRESPCMLTTYAVILLTIFLLQIAVGIYAFLEIKDQDVFKAKVKNTLTSLFNEYGTKNASQELVDLIQQELECCGTTGPTYWDTSKPNTCYEDSKPTNKLFTNGSVSGIERGGSDIR
ncbi:hypothetical protein JTB14_021837 [Gonioctena quinquepunctata]|nr:hypothetical protein JTB14_021837 [Gonioctena quinquepunctata]